jgi:hypothetical protein
MRTDICHRHSHLKWMMILFQPELVFS